MKIQKVLAYMLATVLAISSVQVTAFAEENVQQEYNVRQQTSGNWISETAEKVITAGNDNAEAVNSVEDGQKVSTQDMFDYSDLIMGDEDGITRAEWLHDLVVMFNMTVEDNNIPDNYFSDLDDTSQYYKDVLTATQFGVVDVMAGGEVRPDEPAEREFASQTLSFCLGFDQTGITQYTYSDYGSCTYPAAAQIALDRGWFTLDSGAFVPEKTITSDEIQVMVDDTNEILASEVVNGNYECSYNFADDVIEVPDGTEVTVEDGTVRITECPVTVSEGAKFAVYQNGIPTVYTAVTVSTEDSVTTITTEAVEDDDAFVGIDAQDVIPADMNQIVPADGVEVTYEESSTSRTTASNSSVQTYADSSIEYQDVSFDKTVPLVDGVSVGLKVRMNNPTVYYRTNTESGEAMVYLESDVEISYSLSSNLAESVDIGTIPIAYWGIKGIGGININVKLNLGGTATGINKAKLAVGLAYNKNSGVRLIRNFYSKNFSLSAQLNASVALEVKAGLTEMPILKAYVFAEAGGKAQIDSKTYNDGETPEECSNFFAYLYVKYGAKGGVKFAWIDKTFDLTENVYDVTNSPVRISRHYEDGKEVPACTRNESQDTEFVENGYVTPSTSNYADSGLSFAADNSGSGDSGNGSNGSGSANIGTEDEYSFSVDKYGYATITDYKGTSTSVAVPSYVSRGDDIYTVVKLSQTFCYNEFLESVFIPDTVKAIFETFVGCKRLKNVILPSGILEIGANTFLDCVSLTELDIPNSVDTIGRYAFNGCISLKNITIPDSVTTIGAYAFQDCTELINVDIGNGIEEIDGYTFQNCSGLTNVTLGNNVTIIGNYAFDKCSNLLKIFIPDSVNAVGDYAFAQCTELADVVLGKGVKTIGASVFSECKKLEELTLPDGLISIGDSAFKNTGLYECIIPDSVESIYSYILKDCHNLQNVVIGDNAKFFGDVSNVFSGCENLRNVVIGDSVTEIAANMFYRKEYLSNVKIGSGVKIIGNEAFAYCNKLTDIKITGNLEIIGIEAFRECISLSQIDLPDSVETISDGAFSGCTGITNISLPNNLIALAKNTFYKCSKLSSITMGINVEAIGNSCFYNCTALGDISLPDSVETIGSYVFQNCSALKEIVLPANVSSVGNSAFYGCSSLGAITIENTVCEIYNSANTIPASAVIYSYLDSTAQTYAEKYNRTFVVLNEVEEELEIISQPVDYIGEVGTNAVFTIEATGEGLSYQWQYQNVGSTSWRDSSQSGSRTAQMTVPVTEARDGQKYRCIVTDKNGDSVTSDIVKIQVGTTVIFEITSQPVDTAGAEGEEASFHVEATGEDLSYQWQYCDADTDQDTWKNSFDSGNQTDTLTVTVTGGKDGSRFRCVVTDKGGNQIISNEAVLNIKYGLVITDQPRDFEGSAGGTAVFEINAVGYGITYQWQYCNAGSTSWRNSSMAGNKTSTLMVFVTESRNGQRYRCVVRNSDGDTVISEEAAIVIREEDSLEITSHPVDYVGKVGDTATFSVEASGKSLTYQWQYQSSGGSSWKDSSQSGNKTKTLSIPVTEARNGQKYRCVITDGYRNQVISNAATLRVESEAKAVTITGQPRDYVGEVGETAVFTVEADGTGLTYQWEYQNVGTTIWKSSSQSGNKTNTLSVPITEARDGQKYRCVITDEVGNQAISDAAALHVGSTSGSEGVTITGQPVDYTGAEGETAIFTVTVSGEGLSYQWQYQNVGTSVWRASGQSGNKTNTLSVPITAARDGQKYRCVVTDSSGNSVTSDAAVLHVNQ